MTLLEDNLSKPADFIIDTPDAVRRFFALIGPAHKKRRISRIMQIGISLLSHIKYGSIDIVLPHGEKLRFEGQESGRHVALILHRERAIKRFLKGGRLGFCEAYIDGDWSSPDLAAFFAFILENANVMQNVLEGKAWYRFVSLLIHMMRPNTRRGSRKNIYNHYDIGNAFYSKWLDESMTYSAAIFKDEHDTDLKQAQDRKYARMVQALDLGPEHHLLEIGCGWGGFAEYAAQNAGCKVTGITISEQQYEYAKDRIDKAGLSGKVDIRLQDYRELDNTYDRIASIEMFEAVGETYWPVYFNTIKNCLKPDGVAVIQTITINDQDFPHYRVSPDYIQRYIFPGGMLPSPSALDEQIDQAALQKLESFSFGHDYAKTLHLWNKNFQKVWPELLKMGFDTRFKRLWEQYLAYCEAGFNLDTVDVIQLKLLNPPAT